MKTTRFVKIKLNDEDYRFFTTKKEMLEDIKAIAENLLSAIDSKRKYYKDNIILIDYIDFEYEGDMYEEDIDQFYIRPMEEISEIVGGELKKVKILGMINIENECYLFTSKGKRIA